MSKGFLQLSGIVADILNRVDHIPAPGEDVETQEFGIAAGGGFNAMVAAKRLGAQVTYGGTLGTGPFADIIATHLEAEVIGRATERRVAMEQGCSTVIVDRTGERSFISHHGAERAIDMQHLETLDAPSYDWLLLSGYFFIKRQTADVLLPWIVNVPRPPMLVLDPSPIVADVPSDLLAPLLQRSDWISANLAEARAITSVADPVQAALKLAEGRAGAIVRAGAGGCYLTQRETVQHVKGFAVEAIDTTGAGDTHCGAFIAAMMAGLAPADACTLANAAAAISVTRKGPATAPALQETLDFLKSRGIILPWNKAS